MDFLYEKTEEDPYYIKYYFKGSKELIENNPDDHTVIQIYYSKEAKKILCCRKSAPSHSQTIKENMLMAKEDIKNLLSIINEKSL